MNINGKQVKNIIYYEQKKMFFQFIKYHLGSIEKKIIIASRNGYDYIWYKIPRHFKHDNDEVCSEIIKELEKNKFSLRLFENNLIQIIW